MERWIIVWIFERRQCLWNEIDSFMARKISFNPPNSSISVTSEASQMSLLQGGSNVFKPHMILGSSQLHLVPRPHSAFAKATCLSHVLPWPPGNQGRCVGEAELSHLHPGRTALKGLLVHVSGTKFWDPETASRSGFPQAWKRGYNSSSPGTSVLNMKIPCMLASSSLEGDLVVACGAGGHWNQKSVVSSLGIGTR